MRERIVRRGSTRRALKSRRQRSSWIICLTWTVKPVSKSIEDRSLVAEIEVWESNSISE